MIIIFSVVTVVQKLFDNKQINRYGKVICRFEIPVKHKKGHFECPFFDMNL